MQVIVQSYYDVLQLKTTQKYALSVDLVLKSSILRKHFERNKLETSEGGRWHLNCCCCLEESFIIYVVPHCCWCHIQLWTGTPHRISPQTFGGGLQDIAFPPANLQLSFVWIILINSIQNIYKMLTAVQIIYIYITFNVITKADQI